MPSHYSSRDPDMRAADQGAGCIIALLLLIIFAPLILLYRWSRIERPYKPYFPDVPASRSKPRKMADYTLIDWTVYIICLSILALGIASGQQSTIMVTGGVAMIGGLALAWWQSQNPPKSALSHLPDLNAPSTFTHSRTYVIYPPKTRPDFITDEKLIRALLSAMPQLSFQIAAEPNKITWRIVDLFGHYNPQTVTDTLRSYLSPECLIEMMEGMGTGIAARFPFYRDQLYFALQNDYAAPISFLSTLKQYDPLTALTQRMDLLDAQCNERLIYQVMVTTATDTARTIGAKRYEQGSVKPLPGVPNRQNGDKTGLDDNLIEAKLADTLFHCFVGVTVESSKQERLPHLKQVAQDLTQFAIPGHNALMLGQRISVSQRVPKGYISSSTDEQITAFAPLLLSEARENRTWANFLLVLSASEIAALWHFPNDLFLAKHIAWAGTPIPAELSTKTPESACLGQVISPSHPQPVYLLSADRAYHHYVTGKTGMGKSTLMHNLIHQDIERGCGVVVIDPHGKLIDDILLSSVSQTRLNDVVLLECGQTACPVPLNPFRIPDGVSFTSAFNYLYWVLSKVYESVWRPGRMDLVFRNLLHALLCDAESTPLDIERLFTDKSYRSSVIAKVGTHPDGSTAVQNYWRSFGAKSRSEQAEISSPIMSRTGIFLGNRALEFMTCHPDTSNFQALVRGHKIVLVNLAGEAIRSEVGSLGAMFLAGFYMASEAIGYIPDNALPRCYLYVDEVERIITTPLPDMYAQARKAGISLTLANQYLDQLTDDTLHGILGNVGTKFVFECGDRDARTLAPELEPQFDRHTLQNLGKYHAVVKTRFAGKALTPFVVETLPPPPRTQTDLSKVREQIRRHNRFKSAQEVQDWLNKRYTPEPPDVSSEAAVEPPNPLGDYE